MIVREKLSADGLHSILAKVFKRVPEHRVNSGNIKIPMIDALKSGFAVFSLKSPSLLNFEKRSLSVEEGANIKSLYGIENIPSDTQLRDILDPVAPSSIAPAFKKIFTEIQRGKDLRPFLWDVNNSYLLPIDATGYFSSTNVHCDHCLIKELKNKTVKDIQKEIATEVKKEFKNEIKNNEKLKTKADKKSFIDKIVAERLAKKLQEEDIFVEKVYQHQMLGMAIVHPEQKVTIPLCPEPIINSDGATKNDCEINASKRLLKQFKNDHPHLNSTILGDDLYSRAPFIKNLEAKNLHYLLVAKESSHEFMFDYIDALKENEASARFEKDENLPDFKTLETVEEEGIKIIKTITRKYEFTNGIPLNDSNQDMKVNFLEYWEHEDYIDKDGIAQSKTRFHSSWITDIKITEENIYKIMRGARSRWSIENGVFNTLKNQGYNLDHNFGHGSKNLSTNFAMLMMLAFLVDQTQELCCKLFQAVRERAGPKYELWAKIKGLLEYFKFENWEMLLRKMIYSVQLPAELGMINTS